MGIFTDDYSDSQSVETKWWNLMESALDKKLCIKLEKHIDSRNFKVLYVRIFPIDKKPSCLFSEYDLCGNVELFYKAEKFVEDYNK